MIPLDEQMPWLHKFMGSRIYGEPQAPILDSILVSIHFDILNINQVNYCIQSYSSSRQVKEGKQARKVEE